ncbi:unnamed protein product [Brassica oleracea var. botrytis]
MMDLWSSGELSEEKPLNRRPCLVPFIVDLVVGKEIDLFFISARWRGVGMVSEMFGV